VILLPVFPVGVLGAAFAWQAIVGFQLERGKSVAVFGRFAYNFSAIFELHFGYLFWPCWRDDLRVYRCFLDVRCWPGPVFGRFWTSF
jgi:hypothetical protein